MSRTYHSIRWPSRRAPRSGGARARHRARRRDEVGSVPAAGPRRIDHHPHRTRDVCGDGVPASPTVTAMSAWTLQHLSGGRFTLGLGTQVRGHVRRRFGMEWHAPRPGCRHGRRDPGGVGSWQAGEPLRFESERYDLSLMVPLFDPSPIERPEMPIPVRGDRARPWRRRRGCRRDSPPPDLHDPLHRRAHQAGSRAGCGHGQTDDGSAIEYCMKPLVATTADDALLARVKEIVRNASRSRCQLRRTGRRVRPS